MLHRLVCFLALARGMIFYIFPLCHVVFAAAHLCTKSALACGVQTVVGPQLNWSSRWALDQFVSGRYDAAY